MVNDDLWMCLYRPMVTPSPLERGKGVCEFSLIDRKITHPLSPIERGNRYSRHYVTNTKYTSKSSFIDIYVIKRTITTPQMIRSVLPTAYVTV